MLIYSNKKYISVEYKTVMRKILLEFIFSWDKKVIKSRNKKILVKVAIDIKNRRVYNLDSI